MNPNEIIPWMDNKEINLVLKYLNEKPNSTMLEWGCGGSTLLFPKYVKHYTSIEHNLDWYVDVQKAIEINNLNNVDFYLVDIPKGVPTKREDFYDKWTNEIHELSRQNLNTVPELDNCIYPKDKYIWLDYIDVVDEIGIEKYDFVFIDGRARSDCAFKALQYIHDDSIVFIHDFWGREEYHAVLKYYDVVDAVKDTLIPPAGMTIVALRRKVNETD